MKSINYFLNRSLKRRIIFKVLLVLFVIQGGLFALGGYAWFNWEKGEQDEFIRNKARVFMSLTREVNQVFEFNYVDKNMPDFSFSDKFEPRYFRLMQGDKLVRKSKTLMHRSYQINQPVSNQRFYDITFSNGKPGRLYRKTFYPDQYDSLGNKLSSQSDQQFVIEVATGVHQLEQKKIKLIIFLLICFYLLIFFTALAVYKVISKGLSYLSLLQKEIDQFDDIEGNTRFLEDKSAPDEIRAISKQFNLFLDKLRISFLREKNLSANLAHELRTPISEIKTLSEVAIDSHKKGNDFVDFYGDILDSASYLESVTNNLISISRNESVDFSDQIILVDLRQQLDSCLKRFEDKFNKCGFSVQVDFCQQTHVFSNVYAIDLILNNLLQNIVQYADKNSEIRISFLKQSDLSYRLRVENDCQELERTDIDFVFDRLWRKNKYRTRGKNAGLGLSLVKSYIDILGLSIQADLINNRFIIEISGFTDSFDEKIN